MGKAGVALKAAKMLKAAKRGARESTRPWSFVQSPSKATGLPVRARRQYGFFHAAGETDYDLGSRKFGELMKQAQKTMKQLKKMFPKEYRAIKNYGDIEANPSMMAIKTTSGIARSTKQASDAAKKVAFKLGATSKQGMETRDALLAHARRLAERGLLPAGTIAAAANQSKEKK